VDTLLENLHAFCLPFEHNVSETIALKQQLRQKSTVHFNPVAFMQIGLWICADCNEPTTITVSLYYISLNTENSKHEHVGPELQ
jgi:hypothetical protein